MKPELDKIYDVIIVGAGPAGLTAALYCGRAGFATLMLEKLSLAGRWRRRMKLKITRGSRHNRRLYAGDEHESAGRAVRCPAGLRGGHSAAHGGRTEAAGYEGRNAARQKRDPRARRGAAPSRPAE